MDNINSFQVWVETQNPFLEEQHKNNIKDQLAQQALELAANCSRFGFKLEDVMIHAINKNTPAHQEDAAPEQG